MMVDFPAPVAPTRAMVWPAGTEKLMSRMTGSFGLYPNEPLKIDITAYLFWGLKARIRKIRLSV